MNDIVAKPIIIAELLSCISQWIKPKKSSPTIAVITHKKIPENHTSIKFSAFKKLKFTAINSKLGLELCDQDISFYAKLLDLFYQSQYQFVSQFNSAKSDHDFTVMNNLTHALKGASSTIGATKLQQIALTLELMCSAEDRYKEEYFYLLKIELDKVLSEIKKVKFTCSHSYSHC